MLTTERPGQDGKHQRSRRKWWSSVFSSFPTMFSKDLFPHTGTNTTFFPKPLTTFLICFSRGERRKYARKKVHLNQVSKSEPPGLKSDTLTTEPPGRDGKHQRNKRNCWSPAFSPFPTMFSKDLFRPVIAQRVVYKT